MFSQAQRTVLLAAACTATAVVAAAQTAPPLTMPRQSQKASVSQTVGLTEITISYSRPAVRGRQIWGALVPYGEVWRAGANENTTISFTSPVRIAGHDIAAGTYGLHVIPRADATWTVILSRVHTAWGSFDYDPKEDAARFEATPEDAPHQEVMTFSLDDPGPDSVTAALRWAELRLPFVVDVDTPAVVMASLRDQLHGLHQFFWQPWNQAAGYALRAGDVEQAKVWAERSVEVNRTFANVATLSRVMAATGDGERARALIDEALPTAAEAELNAYGYQLLAAGDTAEAVAMFRLNVERHPDSWNVHDSLGEGLAAAGATTAAVRSYRKALEMAPDAQKGRIEGILARLAAP